MTSQIAILMVSDCKNATVIKQSETVIDLIRHLTDTFTEKYYYKTHSFIIYSENKNLN